MQAQIARPHRQQVLKRGTNNLLEWMEHQSEAKETELAYILRWEDDGGFIIQASEIVSYSDQN